MADRTTTGRARPEAASTATSRRHPVGIDNARSSSAVDADGEFQEFRAGRQVRRVEKPWGHELIWAETDRYAGKLLVIESGRRLSLQYHRRKLESIFVLSGRLRLWLEGDDGVIRDEELGAGDARAIPVGRTHRFEAIARVELAEVSSPELDDVVRVQDDFGRAGTAAP